MVSGVVEGVEIVAVTGNEATVEIRIAVQLAVAPGLVQPAPPAAVPNPPPGGELAYVIHVSDGDTLDVLLSSTGGDDWWRPAQPPVACAPFYR